MKDHLKKQYLENIYSIQLIDVLRALVQREVKYAYNFEGRRYDVGEKQGYLEATVEFALRRPVLREEFLKYLLKVIEKEKKSTALGEVAITHKE